MHIYVVLIPPSSYTADSNAKHSLHILFMKQMNPCQMYKWTCFLANRMFAQNCFRKNTSPTDIPKVRFAVFFWKRAKRYRREFTIWPKFTLLFLLSVHWPTMHRAFARRNRPLSRHDTTGHLIPDKPSGVGTTRHLSRARCPEREAGAWPERMALGRSNGPTPGGGHVNLGGRGVEQVRRVLARSLAYNVTICLLYTSPSPRD